MKPFVKTTIFVLLLLTSIKISLAADKDVSCTNSGCSGFDGPLFSSINMVPGEAATKTFSIQNDKDENVKVLLSANQNANSDTLFLKNIQVEINNTSNLYSGNMNSFLLAENINLGIISEGTTNNYEMTLGLYPNAPNEIQEKSVSFSLILTIEGEETGETESLESNSGDNSDGSSDDKDKEESSGSVLGVSTESLLGQVLGLSSTSSSKNLSIGIVGIVIVLIGLIIIKKSRINK